MNTVHSIFSGSVPEYVKPKLAAGFPPYKWVCSSADSLSLLQELPFTAPITPTRQHTASLSQASPLNTRTTFYCAHYTNSSTHRLAVTGATTEYKSYLSLHLLHQFVTTPPRCHKRHHGIQELPFTAPITPTRHYTAMLS
ncbi:hypothetical protein J6590_025505 [Homalodisca vitripennis]|nr:hypothetical protein J6590_025505 [Homalodisca vitripennis]